MCWLLSLEEHLRDHVAWPEELLGHELGDELVVSVPQPVHTHPANPHGVPLHLHSNGVVIGDAAGGTASWLASPSLGDVSLGTMGVAGADRAGSADRAEETQGWAAGLAGVLTSRRGRLSRKVSESGLGPAELHSGGPGQQQQQEQQQQGKRQGQLGRTRTSFMPRMGQRRMFRRYAMRLPCRASEPSFCLAAFHRPPSCRVQFCLADKAALVAPCVIVQGCEPTRLNRSVAKLQLTRHLPHRQVYLRSAFRGPRAATGRPRPTCLSSIRDCPWRGSEPGNRGR